jgi:hypothetical protein
MINLSPESVLQVPIAELAHAVLIDLIASQVWSSWNYINEAEQGPYSGAPAQAISGALSWLHGQGLIAHDPLNGSAWSAIVVTPAGRRATGL